MDSDTDSDSECNSGTLNTVEFTRAITQGSQIDLSSQNVSTEDVKNAISLLMDIDVQAVTTPMVYERIHHASKMILCLLDEIICARSSDAKLLNLLRYFLELTSPIFLSKLFEYRQAFYSIAARLIAPGTAPSVVVCWVDVILTKLSDATLVVVSGTHSDLSSTQAFNSLHKQQEDDAIRAATQLPRRWDAVPDLLASEHASPALARLALRLLFAAYTVHPQLTGDRRVMDEGIIRMESTRVSKLRSVLRSYILKQSSNNYKINDTSVHGRSTCPDTQQRIAYAMVISLYTMIESQTEPSHVETPSSSYEPYTQTLFLRLIQDIMELDQPGNTMQPIVPQPELDPAQTILVRWGRLIPWCWETWADPRCADVESIFYCTATWLYHLGDRRKDGVTDDWPWDVQLSEVLATNAQGAKAFILQLLHHGVAMLLSLKLGDAPATALDVLYKCCWAITRIINPIQNLNVIPTSVMARYLFTLWALLGDTKLELSIKELITESLIYVKRGSLQKAFKGMLGRHDLQLILILERRIAALRREVNNAKERALTDCTVLSIALMLKFLTIVWHNNIPLPLHQNVVSPFLSDLVDYLVENPSPCRALVCSLVIALSTLEFLFADPAYEKVVKLWNFETLWQLTILCGPSDVLAASTLSSCILATSSLVADNLARAESWDLLRDTLILTLSHRFFADDKPLALLTAPTVCRGMVRLLDIADSGLMQWIVTSPWTTALRSEIRKLLEDSNPHSSMERAILKERLARDGKKLVNAVEQKTNEGATNSLGSCRLMYCKPQNSNMSYLILIPDVS